ncbi:YheT family hydrolase [Amphibiibacter pelophylacis]|uniref:Alpha/beta fold hydrolase n=1 Tax=Amphibiibacter pelophylacis TaxID=1799477 RepID=A0ACC6NY69_9BURK
MASLPAPGDAPLSTAPWPSPAWLPGGQVQTVLTGLAARALPRGAASLPLRRERWTTPDGDFLDIDRLDADPAAPMLVLLHGLEGSSASNYAQAFGHWARQNGWACALPHFRGCSGEINVAPRAYFSGDAVDVNLILTRLRQHCSGPLVVVGVSLGGNALLRWAQTQPATQVLDTACALVTLCAPLDLTRCGDALDTGLNRFLYTPMFLRTMQAKAETKLRQFPGLFDGPAMRAARTLRAFDDVFTGPLHGYRDAADYWLRASSLPLLHTVPVPALVVNPRNDPFVPAACLPGAAQAAPGMTLWQPPTGGHMGFATAPFPGDLQALPQAMMAWAQQRMPMAGWAQTPQGWRYGG